MHYLKTLNIMNLSGFLSRDRFYAIWVPYTNGARYQLTLPIKILLLILLFLSCNGCQNREFAEELDAIAAKLTMIEQRITQLEKMEQRISAYEFQLKELQESLAKLESPVSEIPEAPQATNTQPKEKSNVRQHVVRSGDSLYGISKEYGLTVEELVQLNNLTKGQVIYPGQKLLVESKRTQ